MKKKIYTANTTILHNNKKYEQFILVLEIIHKLGLESIFDDKEFKISRDDIIEYLKEREYIFSMLFNVARLDIDNIIKDKNFDKIVIKYLSNRLKYMFNISIVIANRNKNTYKLKLIENWTNKFNPMKENPDLIMEYNNLLFNLGDIDENKYFNNILDSLKNNILSVY